MAEADDDLVRIDASGVTRPVGETARVRLQGREGEFHVLPSPPHLVFLRREATDQGEGRACLLSGEIRAPGMLCDVVSLLGRTGQKGELLVLERGSSRSVFFEDGYVVAGRSSIASERLGETLLRFGVLDETQLAACRQESGRRSIRLGEAAVHLGFVTRERLFGLMALQTQEIFHAALVVTAGAFYFLASFDEAQLAVRHHLSIPTLVRDAVRRMHEVRFFRTRIPSPHHVPVATAHPLPPEAELHPVYAALDGKRSVVDLGRTLGLSEFEATRAVFQLVQSGHAAIHRPRLTPKAAVTVYNEVVSLLLIELDAIDQGDALREHVARRLGATPLSQVTQGAGPADDGRFDADRVAANVAGRPDAPAVEEALRGWLHDLASYALFVAQPHLQRAQARAKGTPAERVSLTLSGMLEPLAPAGGTAPGDRT